MDNSRDPVSQTSKNGRIRIKTSGKQISVNRKGELSFSRKSTSVPSWRTIKRVDFIQVPSMFRFSYCTKADANTVKGVVKMYCKFPSETMLKIQCDKCSGPHLQRNKTCSATLGINSRLYASTPGFYDVQTGQKISSKLIKIDEEFSRSGNVSRISFLK